MSLTPQQIVDKMMSNDAFSKWLGIEVVEIKEGYAELCLHVNEQMLNGFLIAHGGISYALADSCLAFASNSYGKQAVSIHTDIKHLRPVNLNDKLYARSREIHRGRSTASYEVEVRSENELVAHFNGLVKISKESWT